MKRPKVNSRKSKRGLSYGILEPRQLLATTGFAQFDGDQTVQSGLIVNGNFNANDIEDMTASHVAIDDVAGWNATDGASGTLSLVGLDNSPRGTALHLDYRADVLESIFQDVDTEVGQAYKLAFDLRGRSVADDADPTTNEIRVLWDGSEVGTFRGISFWQNFTVDVSGGANDLTRLEIQEIDGAGNDGIGPVIDNILLVRTTEKMFDNGSFENNVTGTVLQENFPAWSVIAEEGEESFDVRDDSPSDGNNYLNLDRQNDASDIIFTNVTTETGARYFLSFDLRAGSGASTEGEEVRVRWNDQWLSTYRGDADWQSYGVIVTADAETTRLVFREPGETTGDGVGPFLDNVRLVEVNSIVTLGFDGESNFTFNENDPVTQVASGLTATSTDSSAVITGAVVRLDSVADFSTETLTVSDDSTTPATEISSDTDGLLNLTGSRTLAEYLSILQTLSYQNTSENPNAGVRQVSVTLLSGDVSSNTSTVSIDVVPVNDAPEVEALLDANATVGQEFQVNATAVDADFDSIVWSVSASGSAIEAGDNTPTIDQQGVLRWTPDRAGTATIVVRATDGAGLFDEQQFVVTSSVSQFLDTGIVTVNSGTDLPAFVSPDPAVGETIADFTAQTQSGETFNSFETGVARIYSLFAHWCPFCQTELPIVSDWLATANLPSDVEYVAISTAVDSTLDNYPPSTWFETEGFGGTVVVDSAQDRLFNLFRTPGFPFLVAVDASGTVVERISGEVTTEKLDQLVATLSAS
jgi:thiol-disulfide isomerase/thioredoxin